MVTPKPRNGPYNRITTLFLRVGPPEKAMIFLKRKSRV